MLPLARSLCALAVLWTAPALAAQADGAPPPEFAEGQRLLQAGDFAGAAGQFRAAT